MLSIDSVDKELISKYLKVSTEVGDRQRFLRMCISTQKERKK